MRSFLKVLADTSILLQPENIVQSDSHPCIHLKAEMSTKGKRKGNKEMFSIFKTYWI